MAITSPFPPTGRRRWALRLTTVGAVAAVVIGAVTVASTGAIASTDSGVPDDQPLPGYTINNPPLAPLVVNGQPTTVLQGVDHHAGYDIEVPPNWNGDLVMWSHGFRGQGFVLTVDVPSFLLRQRFINEGYAWAASSYYDNGYDVRAGVLSTKDLADAFSQLVDRPHRTYIAGVSLGGHVVGRSLEQFPNFYDGALPMCGVLGDQALFDYFLDFNLVAQDLANVHAYPIPLDYLTNPALVPQIQANLGLTALTPTNDTTNDLGKQFRSIMINRSGGERPGGVAAFAFWKNFLFNLATPAVPPSPDDTLAERPGQIATNVLTQYTPNTPVDVNGTIQRVPPENFLPRLSPLLTQIPRILGRPHSPVVSLHGLGDLFVPFFNEQLYQADAARHDQAHNVVQRAIRTINHCEFSPNEAGRAWDDLVAWVTQGTPPAGDTVNNPAAVADPDYGCTFSDQAAFTAGTGTRRLFAACP